MITAGPDGALWFSESDVLKTDNANTIGRLTTTGSFTQFSPPTANSEPQGITVGSDGALWFTEAGGNNIGRVTTGGNFTEFAVPTANSVPFGIAIGPDRTILFTEFSGNKIGEITVPNPALPAATTADMILRRVDGTYQIYDLGDNAILASTQLGQVGTDFQFAGLGGFNGTDTTDMLLRNGNTGAFQVYDISNNNITNSTCSERSAWIGESRALAVSAAIPAKPT
jgi:virginiamycin B lyase